MSVSDDAQALTPNYREWLDYDPATGEFRWKKRAYTGAGPGELAGGLRHGYRRIELHRKRVFAHRLAWWFVHGHFPDGQIDHINGIRTDNRIANLRIATGAENQHSIFKATKRSTTGVRGVSKTPWGFEARITACGKNIHLGTHPTSEQAHEAYLEAKEKYHPASRVSKPHFVSEATARSDS